MKTDKHSIERLAFGPYVSLTDEHIFDKFGIHFPNKEYEVVGSSSVPGWPKMKMIIDFVINNTDYKVINISNSNNNTFVYLSK